MSKYKEIKGFKVQTLASDPVASQLAGGTWASGASLNNGITEGGGSGTPSSAVNVGGYPYPSTNEHYNGSVWATFAQFNSPRGKTGSTGTYTAALVAAGETPSTPGPGVANVCESWNGSAWTEVNDLNTSRSLYGMSGAGTNTATILFGGANGGSKYANTESWNGSSWTEVNDLNRPNQRESVAGGGTNTSAFCTGGNDSPASALNELWDGTSWTESGDLNNARGYQVAGGVSSTDSIVFGGLNPGPSLKANTEIWNGSSWTEVADLATARYAHKGAGNGAPSALCWGGSTPPTVATMEVWSAPSDFNPTNLGQVYYNSGSNAFKVTAQPVADGTWASATSLNSARAYIGSAGLKTAFLAFGGNGHVGVTESYNGSSWTEVADLNTGRFAGASGGSQTAAFMAGGRISTTNSTVVSEEWNGSSWAEGNDMNLERYAITTGIGTQTAGLAVGGNKRFSPSASPEFFAGTEEYNGTSWTEVNDLPTAMESAGGIGTQTAAGQWGGYGGSYINSGFLYDGTSWTTTTNFPISGGNFSTSGTTTAGLMFGIFDNGPGVGVANNLSWDGTSFTEVADLGTARNAGGGPTATLGTTSSAILAGGYSNTYVANTEEWTVDASNKTITVS